MFGETGQTLSRDSQHVVGDLGNDVLAVALVPIF